MRAAAGAAAIAAVVVTHATAQMGQCDQEATCTFQTPYQGSVATFDFRRLCRPQQDYIFVDAVYGHTYYAQICGKAAKSCLPEGWENDYQFGNVIQTWGSAPECLNVTESTCVDSRTGLPACCSEPCQVVAIETTLTPPVFSTIVPGDASQGVRVTYFGETPTQNDPYSCDYDPTTGAPYPRVTHMEFYCDASATEFANFYEVAQNATDGCDYTLRFKTSIACVGAAAGAVLSGGWVFCIVVMVVGALYAIIGAIVTWRKEGILAFPNRHFWYEFDALVLDGLRFLVRGCKKGPRGSKLTESSAEATPFTNASSSSGSGAAAASSGSGAAEGRSAYQTIGAASEGPAYADL